MSVKPRAMRDAFLDKIWQSMAKDEKIFFLSADFGSPVLDKIRSDFPERFINVGISEQNLINISAGLALEGYTVFAYAIAPFITMRCFEQIRVSLALLSEVRPMNVNLIGVGAGYSYVVSGPTHQCYEDLTLMRALPNFRVLSPADHIIAALLFDSCTKSKGLKYIRMDAQVLPIVYEDELPDISDGFYVHQSDAAICFVATGYMLHTAKIVAKKLDELGVRVGIIDIFDLSNFNKSKLASEISKYSGLVSLEEGFRGRGGLDSLMFDFISRENLDIKMLNLGVEPGYRFELGSRLELHEKVGIGPEYVLKSVCSFIEKLELNIWSKNEVPINA